MDAFRWDCRTKGTVCVRNPLFCGECGSVDVEIDQNVEGLRGDGMWFTCWACGRQTQVPSLVLGGRWGAIRAEEQAEAWDAEDAGWDAALRHTYVRVAGPGPEWVGFLAYYRRDCADGHRLTGTAVVEVIDPGASGREPGALVEVGAACLRKAGPVAQEWREAERCRARTRVKELEERSCGK